MAPKTRKSTKGKTRLRPDDIFGEFEDMILEIEGKLFVPDEDDDLYIPENARFKASISFHRAIFDDLRPDPEHIEDDLVTNAAIYAYYAFQLAEAKKYLSKAEHEYQMLWGRVYQLKCKEIWKDPDLDPKIKTQTYIKSVVDNIQSVAIMVTIVDRAKNLVFKLEEGMKALEQKHYNCQAIARMRSGEARLVGSTYLPSERRDKPTPRRPYEDNETNPE